LGFPQAVCESLDTSYASLRSAPFYPPSRKNFPVAKQRKERSTMEKIYEIQRIKQVVQEVEDRYIIRCPEDAARVAAHFISDDDREVFFVMCLNGSRKI
jgi:hypothetical protein